MPCLGGFLRDASIAIPERHLGLVTREDHPLEDRGIARLADWIEERLDLDRLIGGLPAFPAAGIALEDHGFKPVRPARIGVARDNAFCFYYPDNLELLRGCGAHLLFFSPMRDEELPSDLDGIYLGGGYPELFAAELAANESMRRRIREQSAAGMPVYAECGGFMYLCRELQDHQGRRFPMAGCFPFNTRMLPRLKALGYREVQLAGDTVIGGRNETIRGHEFHYSEIAEDPDLSRVESIYRVAGRDGIERSVEGFVTHRTLGSYIHLHFASAPQAAKAFVECCRTYRAERTQSA
jgi:cobyrinic acid a,c-diamide synthase